MRIPIVYGTTEGHTRDLAEFAARALGESGHEARAVEAGSAAEPDLAVADAAILAGSLHVGTYQAALTDYARRHHQRLNAMPSAFVSVSLSAAGENPDDWAGLEQCLARFRHETQWAPRAVHHAAGAIRYSHYDFFKRLAMKFIAGKRGKATVTSRDYDLTDYDALKEFVMEFAAASDQVA